MIAAGAAAGVAFFVLLEYAGHRWILHRAFSRAHARHHADPGRLDDLFLPAVWSPAYCCSLR